MANNRPADVKLRSLLLSGTASARLPGQPGCRVAPVLSQRARFNLPLWTSGKRSLEVTSSENYLDFPVAQFNKLVMFKHDDLHPKNKNPNAKEIIS